MGQQVCCMGNSLQNEKELNIFDVLEQTKPQTKKCTLKNRLIENSSLSVGMDESERPPKLQKPQHSQSWNPIKKHK